MRRRWSIRSVRWLAIGRKGGVLNNMVTQEKNNDAKLIEIEGRGRDKPRKTTARLKRRRTQNSDPFSIIFEKGGKGRVAPERAGGGGGRRQNKKLSGGSIIRSTVKGCFELGKEREKRGFRFVGGYDRRKKS